MPGKFGILFLGDIVGRPGRRAMDKVLPGLVKKYAPMGDKKHALPYPERDPRLLRPANYPPVNPGRFSYIFQAADGVRAAVLNLQGRVFMCPLDCPFKRADEEVAALAAETPIILVDFHAEATSEKQALGWYLDGRVSAVIGP